MTCRTAQQSAQNVASALVGGDHTVADHEARRTDVVGDNTQRNVGLGIVAVIYACLFADGRHDITNGVNLEEVVYTLHNAGKTLKSHTGVDIGLCEACIVVVTVVVKLCENEVPEFHISVAVAAGLTVGLSATEFFAAVEVKLGARSAGSASVFPEVVRFTKTDDSFSGDSDVFCPDIEGFVVVKVNSYPDAVFGKLDNLGAEFPCPRNSFFFEVIAEREVSEHFKVSTVSCGDTNSVDVGCTDTLLTGGHSVARGFFLTCEILFKRSHTRVYKQNRFVIYRHEREALMTKMTF